ncbi:MAG: outer membrane beta-barrel protein [Tatlockia sp.]|nr:outer membrane beta-barrel protein [Tatlockia sp.]
MKDFSKLALAGLLFVNSAFAATPAEGWYAGITGGISLTPNFNFRSLSHSNQTEINNEICRLNVATSRFLQANPFDSSFFNPLIPGCNPSLTPITSAPILVPTAPVIAPVNIIINPNNQFYNNNNFNNNYNNNNNNDDSFNTDSAPQFIPLLRGNSLVSLNHTIGGNFAGQVGFRICNFRIEGELLVNYAPLTEVTIGGLTLRKKRGLLRTRGQTIMGAGLLNAYYDFYDEEDDPTWVPYIGLGIGYSAMQSKVNITSVNPSSLCPNLFTPFACIPRSAFSLTLSSNSSSPVGQGILGISYYTSDNFAVGVDYRYLTTSKISDFGGRVSMSSLNLNLNYWFGDN